MRQIQCPNCLDWQDETISGAGLKPDGGLLGLVLGGGVLGVSGAVFMASYYTAVAFADPEAGPPGHASLIVGGVLVACGAICFGLALWLYRTKRVGGAVTGGSMRHCESCGHDWDEYSHTDLRADMPHLSVPSEELVRADRDETVG
jgi:hypothetical protein